MALLTISGCSHAGWSYQPNELQPSRLTVPITLAVSQFADARVQENSSHFILCLLPVVPYCNATYHRPDAADDFHSTDSYSFKPSEDLAKAAAQDIRQSGLFQKVYFTDVSQPRDAQLILRGTIINTDWNGTRWTYGLASDGQVLWLVGLPIGTARSTLDVKLELVEQATASVLWTHELRGEKSSIEGLYYGTDFAYPEIFRDQMKETLASLQRFVESKPPEYWARMKSR